MQILGISAYYHDSAAALIRDGIVVAAAQEERFTRKSRIQTSLATQLVSALKQHKALRSIMSSFMTSPSSSSNVF